MTDLLEIIGQRGDIDRMIDKEFGEMPAKGVGARTYYSYRLGRMVMGEAYDLGAKRTQRPAPELDGINDSKVRAERSHPQRDKVAAWLKENGPATVVEIAEAVEMSPESVRTKLCYGGLPVEKTPGPIVGRGRAMLWAWEGEE